MAEEGRVGAMMTRVRTRVGRKRTSLVRASQGIQEPEIQVCMKTRMRILGRRSNRSSGEQSPNEGFQ